MIPTPRMCHSVPAYVVTNWYNMFIRLSVKVPDIYLIIHMSLIKPRMIVNELLVSESQCNCTIKGEL